MPRLFDPDLTVQDLQPAELHFPLFVFVKDLAPLSQEARSFLPTPPLDEKGRPLPNSHPLVTVCAFDDSRLPYMVKLWLPNWPSANIWIPWNCCSPDVTLLPN